MRGPTPSTKFEGNIHFIIGHLRPRNSRLATCLGLGISVLVCYNINDLCRNHPFHIFSDYTIVKRLGQSVDRRYINKLLLLILLLLLLLLFEL